MLWVLEMSHDINQVVEPLKLHHHALPLSITELHLFLFTMKFTAVLGAALLAQTTLAHPGQSAAEHAQEAAERRVYLANNKRSLAHCADILKARGNDVAMHARRSALVERLRAKRAIAQGKWTSKKNMVTSSLLIV
jgi:hypothetical protein